MERFTHRNRNKDKNKHSHILMKIRIHNPNVRLAKDGAFNALTLLQPTGHGMHHQFNIQQLYALPTQCIYVFGVDLRTNNDYFPIQH
jgi:hypothetical protein